MTVGRVWVGWYVVLLVGVVAIALSTLGERSGGLARLDALEESSVAHPGSTLLARGGYNARLTVEGPFPPATWRIYGTSAPATAVIAHFEEEALNRGWEGGPGIPSTSELEAFDWRRDELFWRLGVLDTDEWHQRIDGSADYPTMYEVRVGVRRDAMGD